MRVAKLRKTIYARLLLLRSWHAWGLKLPQKTDTWEPVHRLLVVQTENNRLSKSNDDLTLKTIKDSTTPIKSQIIPDFHVTSPQKQSHIGVPNWSSGNSGALLLGKRFLLFRWKHSIQSAIALHLFYRQSCQALGAQLSSLYRIARASNYVSATGPFCAMFFLKCNLVIFFRWSAGEQDC